MQNLCLIISRSLGPFIQKLDIGQGETTPQTQGALFLQYSCRVTHRKITEPASHLATTLGVIVRSSGGRSSKYPMDTTRRLA